MNDKPDQSELFPKEAAKALSSLGASKGGLARKNILSASERSEIARNAVRARWQKAGKLKPTPEPKKVQSLPVMPVLEPGPIPVGIMPYSMFRGALRIGSTDLECHVLSDGRRVFTQREIVRVLTDGRDSGNLPELIKGNPLIINVDSLGEIIEFKVPGTQFVAFGREATVLIELCEKYLQARDQGVLKGAQKRYAIQAGIIIRACAKVGIIALVDEATGFQQFRKKRDLQIKLQAFIAEELQEWARMFPPEFWFELARLEGIHYSPRNRPLRWGKYIMAFVYDTIDKDVGKRLREINPDPRHGKNHHQWLKEFGREKLIGQIQSVITIMKLCTDMDDFKRKFAKVFAKTPLQTTFEGVDWDVAKTEK